MQHHARRVGSNGSKAQAGHRPHRGMRGEVGERAEDAALEALHPACTRLREECRPTVTCFVPVDRRET